MTAGTQRCGRCKVDRPHTDFSLSYRGKAGTWCRSCFAAYARGERAGREHAARPCRQCGEQYVPKQLKANAAYCSRPCKALARNAAEAASREASKPLRACVWCAADMPRRMRADAKFCSVDCNSKAHASTRKMWQRLGISKGDVPLVSRTYLAQRDGLSCHLCHRKLSLTTKHPDPGYASIDHVIPLARGGTNELANLRLAHLVCNLRKRDVGAGEQLALIG